MSVLCCCDVDDADDDDLVLSRFVLAGLIVDVFGGLGWVMTSLGGGFAKIWEKVIS